MAKHVTPAVHAVFIHTTDLVKSAEWYCRLLELPFDAEQVNVPVYNVQVSGDTYLTIDSHAFDASFTFTPASGPIFNIFSSDLIATYDWITEQEMKVVRQIERDNDFGWFHIEDPDQNIVMICGTIK
mgnify:CR=1 FL=1